MGFVRGGNFPPTKGQRLYAKIQGSYGSGKTWNTWKMGMILKKSWETRKMGKSQGKGQGKYFVCHDQYFSCIIMKKSKKNLDYREKITQLYLFVND